MISFARAVALGALLALALSASASAQTQMSADAVFAGGCFWCMEADYDKVPGVISTTSGYAGGTTHNPTYEQVTAGGTGHKEVVKVVYDPAKVTYPQLLEVFWRNIDPLDARGQFCDKGDSYRAAAFVADETERKLAEASKAAVAARLGKPVVTEVLAEAPFYPAEDYHQDYYKKNPTKYNFYRWNCGRDRRLEQLNGAS